MVVEDGGEVFVAPLDLDLLDGVLNWEAVVGDEVPVVVGGVSEPLL